jgi:hypothetical protein
MLENIKPEIKKALTKNESIINSFNTESKLNILETAIKGNLKVLKQEIDYINLGGDY